MQHVDSESCHRSFLAIALCTTIALFSSTLLADEEKANDWHRAMVGVVHEENFGGPMAGLIVHTDGKKAVALTSLLGREGYDWDDVVGDSVVVSIAGSGTKKDRMPGTIRGRYVFPALPSHPGSVCLAVIEIEQNGVELTALKVAKSAPNKDDAVTAVMRDWDFDKDRPRLERLTVANALNPEVCHPLQGKLSGSKQLDGALLAVLDKEGKLVGIGHKDGMPADGDFFLPRPNTASARVPNSKNPDGTRSPQDALIHESAGFAGGSIPGPARYLHFVALVDWAAELRGLNVPISEELLTAQAKRQRTSSDTFGRPVSSQNIQVTWSDDHKELHGFSNARGEWSKLKIEERDSIIPIVGTNVAAVSLNGSIAAYSGEKGVWDVVKLRPGSQVPPRVSSDVVTVRDGKNYYTFAASSGVWTSPTDPDYQKASTDVPSTGGVNPTKLLGVLKPWLLHTNTRVSIDAEWGNRVTVSGIRHHVDAAAEMLRQLQQEAIANKSTKDTSSDQVQPGSEQNTHNTTPLSGVSNTNESVVRHRVGIAFERDSLKLARQLRQEKKPNADSTEKLRQLVTQSFEERLNQQQELATKLERKFKEIREAIESRQSNRDRIIERRVEELLDPTIDWSKLEPNQDTGNSDVQVAEVPADLSGVVMLEFTASYCQPCQQMIPVMQRMKRDGFPIQTIDITAQPEVSRRHNVDRIPTLIVMVRGKEVERLVGIQSDAKLRRIMNDASRNLNLAIDRSKLNSTSKTPNLPGAGMPATETPVRLPGPPHIPLGGSGVLDSAMDQEKEKVSGVATDLIETSKTARKTADTIRHEQRHLNTYLNLIRQLPDLDKTRKQEIEASIRGSVKKIRNAQQEFRQQVTKWRDLWKTHASRFQDEQAAAEAARDLVAITTLELRNKEATNRTINGAYSADEILTLKSERIAAEIGLLQAERKAKDMQAVREKVAEFNPAEFDTKPLMVDPEIAASRTLMAATSDASRGASEQQIDLRIPHKEFRTEGGSLRVSFDDIDLLKVLNMDAVPRNSVDHFPDWLNNLDGQRVRIRGFMLPSYQATGIRRFALARDNEICSFAREAKAYEVLVVSLAENETTDYIDGKPFDVGGIFKIDPKGDGNGLSQLYRLENAKIIR